MSARKKGLGRGLDALLGGAEVAETSANPGGDLRELPVDVIQRGRYQPRRDIKPEALKELAASIRSQGVMQPIVVRSVSPDRYEIIAGERRWRASQLAGLDKIPVVIKDVADEAAIAMALIENIQREDLNPIEEAVALQRLQTEFELTQQQVADAVGKSRSTVTNILRLMTLHPDVRRRLEQGELEMGHARALLGLNLDDQPHAAARVVKKGLSVRQTESLVQSLNRVGSKKEPEDTEGNADVRRLEQHLAEKLGTQVYIQHSKSGSGKLVVKYGSLEQLDGILKHIE